MKYSEFVELAQKTGFEEKQWFLLWKTWRFELSAYMSDALNEYLAFNPKVKNVREMFRSENNIGVILKKHRKLRVVTQEGIKDKLYNMDRILANCDIEHDDSRLEVVYYPLAYIHCLECSKTVYKMCSEGVWRCVCGHEWIDAFYNIEEIMRVRGVVDNTTPEKNIEKLQEQLPF